MNFVKKSIFAMQLLCIMLASHYAQADISSPPVHDALSQATMHDKEEDTLRINPQLSLRSVLEATFARNPQQLVMQAMTAEAQAKNVFANGFLPYAPAATMRHQNDTVGSGRGEREWEAELELPVWLPGQRNARQLLASESAAGVSASRAGLQMQVAGLVRDAIWDISMNEELAALAEVRLNAARQLEQDVSKRHLAGELAKTDLMLTQNETITAEAVRLKAVGEVLHAKHRYIALTGLNEMPANSAEKISEINNLDENPLLKEAEAKINFAESERGLVLVEKRENPQLTISARSQRGAFDNAYNDSIGVKVRIPFGSEVRSAPQLAAAELNIAKQTAARAQLKISMESILHEAEHFLEIAQAELVLLNKQNGITQESARLAKKAFQLGESDLVNLMRIEATAFESNRAVATKKVEIEWDIARYNQAVGVLP